MTNKSKMAAATVIMIANGKAPFDGWKYELRCENKPPKVGGSCGADEVAEGRAAEVAVAWEANVEAEVGVPRKRVA